MNIVNNDDDEKCDVNEIIKLIENVFCNVFVKSKYCNNRILNGTIVCNVACEWSIWNEQCHNMMVDIITKYIGLSFSIELWYTIYSYIADKDMKSKWNELLFISCFVCSFPNVSICNFFAWNRL